MGGGLWIHNYLNNSKAEINYIFINKKWIDNAVDFEVHSSFDIASSDHRNKKPTAKTSYDWSSLTNSNIRNHYTVIVRNKFDIH